MAIGGNDVKIENVDLSQTLSAADFSGAVGAANNGAYVGTETVERSWFLGGDYEKDVDITSSSFAGIKGDFVTKLDEAIDTYISSITNKLAELNTNPTVVNAFKGEGVVRAIQNLIARVDAEAASYAQALKSKEQQIVKAVHEAYTTHDDSVATDITGDASHLEAAAQSTGSVGGGGSGMAATTMAAR